MNEITGAVLKINEDGTVNIAVGACDLGQGSDTILAQVAGEVLGIDPERIDVFNGDTDFCPYDNGTHSSRQAYMAGNAVKMAAEEARDQLMAAVADALEADAADLACADGRSMSGARRSARCPLRRPPCTPFTATRTSW